MQKRQSIQSVYSQHKARLFTLKHGAVRILGNGEHVGRHVFAFLSFVHLHNIFAVDGEVLVWIDNNTEEARVCLQTCHKAEEKWDRL